MLTILYRTVLRRKELDLLQMNINSSSNWFRDEKSQLNFSIFFLKDDVEWLPMRQLSTRDQITRKLTTLGYRTAFNKLHKFYFLSDAAQSFEISNSKYKWVFVFYDMYGQLSWTYSYPEYEHIYLRSSAVEGELEIFWLANIRWWVVSVSICLLDNRNARKRRADF